jgi:hypothetical protein
LPEVAIVLGAGATVSDVHKRSKVARPPLDKEFFKLSSRAGNQAQVSRVADYMRRIYAVDIRDSTHDSLEEVMSQLYNDVGNPNLAGRARPAFLSLLRLFNERLAETTNNIAATQHRYLYRMLSHFLSSGYAPEVTIVTFNQDLQAEKVLQLLASKGKWRGLRAEIFSFPGLYELAVPSSRVTAPSSGSGALFPEEPKNPRCIRILKLHGSLNWYSSHNSRTPSTSAMFRPSRNLSITRRRDIYMDMTVIRPTRSTHALPVVIPPVTHKTAVLHNAIKPIWTEAEKRLTRADRVVIFGYSCPALDFESSNMLRRSQLAAPHKRTLFLIDPDSATATRYIGLLDPSKLTYYPSADEFLADHPAGGSSP